MQFSVDSKKVEQRFADPAWRQLAAEDPQRAVDQLRPEIPDTRVYRWIVAALAISLILIIIIEAFSNILGLMDRAWLHTVGGTVVGALAGALIPASRA